MRYKTNHSLSLKWMLVFAMILALAVGLAGKINSVRADIAPPKAPPGANPDTGGVITQVRMMDEKVVIEILAEDDITQMGSAFVWAEFHMKNLGDTTEILMVRFPSSFSDGRSGYPEIENFTVYVDNAQVPTSRIDLEGEPEYYYDPVQWVEFEVVFPPGEIVKIEAGYTLYGTGEYPFVSYGYLLQTGAGWNGTIGSAEIIVKLPFTANPGNVFIDSSPGWGGTTPGANLSGNEVSWYFEDFEPIRNISIVMVWPSAWNKVEIAQKQVQDYPNDGETWGRLAKIYKELSRSDRETRRDSGGIWLHNLSKEAYEKCLTLLPDDALWHVGYIDLLSWDSWITSGERASEEHRSIMLDAFSELHNINLLNPENEFVQNYLDQFPPYMIDEVDGEYVFYWLTLTPTLEVFSWQATATKEVLSTGTPIPPEPDPTQPPPTAAETFEEEIPAEESDQKGSLPFCGSIIMFPFALVMILVVPKIQLKKLG